MSLAEVQRRAGKLDRMSGSYVVMTPSGPLLVGEHTAWRTTKDAAISLRFIGKTATQV